MYACAPKKKKKILFVPFPTLIKTQFTTGEKTCAQIIYIFSYLQISNHTLRWTCRPKGYRPAYLHIWYISSTYLRFLAFNVKQKIILKIDYFKVVNERLTTKRWPQRSDLTVFLKLSNLLSNSVFRVYSGSWKCILVIGSVFRESVIGSVFWQLDVYSGNSDFQQQWLHVRVYKKVFLGTSVNLYLARRWFTQYLL